MGTNPEHGDRIAEIAEEEDVARVESFDGVGARGVDLSLSAEGGDGVRLRSSRASVHKLDGIRGSSSAAHLAPPAILIFVSIASGRDWLFVAAAACVLLLIVWAVLRARRGH